MELKNPALYRWPESEEKITILPYKIQKAKADITGTPDPEKLTLIYGQMLSDGLTSETEPDRAKKKTLIAKDMISGIKVKVAEMETAGEWQWKLEESEKKQLAVTENAYKLQAVFQPADESVAKNVEPIEEIFTVKVKKAVPALTCKDFSGKLFNSIDNEGNVVGSYLSNAEINGWVEAKNPITGETIVGTWKATPVEDKVITKKGGGFAYKLTFTPEDTVNYSEAVVENLMIYIHVDYKPVVPTDAPAPTETPAAAPTNSPTVTGN